MDVRTTMIYTHVLNRGGRGVYSLANELASWPDERWAGAIYHAGSGETHENPSCNKPIYGDWPPARLAAHLPPTGDSQTLPITKLGR